MGNGSASWLPSLLSEDFSDGQDISGVKIVNPFEAGNEPLLDLVLPPAET